MAALTITAANVSRASGPVKHGQIAGEAFNAGAALYYKNSDGKWYKAQDDGTAEEAGAYGFGIALGTAAAAGQEISVALPESIVTLGSVVTAGVVYTIDDAAGSIGPIADRASTDKVTVIGLGISATQMLVGHMYNAGAVLA